uniref:glycosyltransferase 87 family protein n=1 Tax=uncultured Amnibacterium sp. TaxID=1631851 RepID=UPI0035CB344B
MRAVDPRRAALVVVVVAVALLAYGVRLSVLLAQDGLLGSSAYDDGVYYAAGASLAHGRWPYADFLFLHPPGVLVALAPFGALGAVAGDPAGVIAARLVWIGIGAASCALIAVLAGRRSLPAGLVAGAAAACFHPLAFGERSTLLEPLGTLLLLVSLVVADRGGPRAAVVAGAAAGLSLDVKIWYVVPVLLLVVLARHRLRFALGAAGAAAVVAAPFLLRAPGPMVRQIVLDQLGRPQEEDTVLDRVTAITGANWLGPDGLSGQHAVVAAAIVVAITLVAAALAWRAPVG